MPKLTLVDSGWWGLRTGSPHCSLALPLPSGLQPGPFSCRLKGGRGSTEPQRSPTLLMITWGVYCVNEWMYCRSSPLE